MTTRAVTFFLILLFVLPSATAQVYQLTAEADHDPWTTTDVDRLAVRLGNCMTWQLTASDETGPRSGIGISVTDSDGRRSLVFTGSSGSVTVGTQTCHTQDRVVDHAFQVTTTLAGAEASSNTVTHEVMWSAGQVYADVPATATGTITVPVWVVWTATNEAMPVDRALVTIGDAVSEISLTNGQGSFQVDAQTDTQVRVAVPSSAWPSGGPGASIVVHEAGPFTITHQEGDPNPDPEPEPEPGNGSGSGGSSGGSHSNEETGSTSTTGQGQPPPAATPERQEQPPAATFDDHGSLEDESPTSDDPASDGGQDDEAIGDTSPASPSTGPADRGIPHPATTTTLFCLLFLAFWRRRTP